MIPLSTSPGKIFIVEFLPVWRPIPLNVIDTLLDDLNTPGFIAKIHELYNAANKGDDKSKKLFNSACKLLGLFDLNKNEWEILKKTNTDISEELILKKIAARSSAKQNGDFKLADQIRDELLNKGVIIEDQKDKTTWKYKWAKKRYSFLIQL